MLYKSLMAAVLPHQHGLGSTILCDGKLLLASTEPLLGLWHVTRKRCDGPSAQSWGEITYLELDAGTVWLQVLKGAVTQGMWWVENGPRPGLPCLVLQLQDGAARALITRLRTTTDGHPQELELCFQSGLELELSTC